MVSSRPRAIIRHELGRALAEWYKRNDQNCYVKLDFMKQEGRRLKKEKKRNGSGRSFENADEFIAELVAEHLEAPTEHARRLLGIFKALTNEEMQKALR